MLDSAVFGSGGLVLMLESLGLTALGVSTSIDGMVVGVSLWIFPTTKSIGVPAVHAVNESGPKTTVLNKTVRNVDTVPPIYSRSQFLHRTRSSNLNGLHKNYWQSW